MKYLNVPIEIEEKVDEKTEKFFDVCYRGIRHVGELNKSYFLPTFVDYEQLEIIAQRRNCGGMAEVIVNNKTKTNFYALSLVPSLSQAMQRFRKSDSLKKDYPQIAEGFTCCKRGKSVQDNDSHISYFLFDYENNNPVDDFDAIDE